MDPAQLTIAGILCSGIVTLAGVVKLLWSKVEANSTALKTELIECEEDRKNLWKKIGELGNKIEKN